MLGIYGVVNSEEVAFISKLDEIFAPLFIYFLFGEDDKDNIENKWSIISFVTFGEYCCI